MGGWCGGGGGAVRASHGGVVVVATSACFALDAAPPPRRPDMTPPNPSPLRIGKVSGATKALLREQQARGAAKAEKFEPLNSLSRAGAVALRVEHGRHHETRHVILVGRGGEEGVWGGGEWEGSAVRREV